MPDFSLEESKSGVSKSILSNWKSTVSIFANYTSQQPFAFGLKLGFCIKFRISFKNKVPIMYGF